MLEKVAHVGRGSILLCGDLHIRHSGAEVWAKYELSLLLG